MVWDGLITSIVCITMTELMVATRKGHVLRYRWDGSQNRDYNLDLRRIPFCINQQVSKGNLVLSLTVCIICVLGVYSIIQLKVNELMSFLKANVSK